MSEPDVSQQPNTRAVLLEGLRQALQARVVQIYMNVTAGGESESEQRAKLGLQKAVHSYENAWRYIHELPGLK